MTTNTTAINLQLDVARRTLVQALAHGDDVERAAARAEWDRTRRELRSTSAATAAPAPTNFPPHVPLMASAPPAPPSRPPATPTLTPEYDDVQLRQRIDSVFNNPASMGAERLAFRLVARSDTTIDEAIDILAIAQGGAPQAEVAALVASITAHLPKARLRDGR